MDTFNQYMVGMNSSMIVIMNPPRGGMTPHEALVLAAWLVSLADPGGDEFPKVLDAVQNGD